MLDKTLEFLRIADAQPTDEKVRKRRESAQDLLSQLGNDQVTLLDLVQGIVAGFASAPLSQESPTVVRLIKSIHDRDATLPHDLKENAIELRAVAGITIGELLAPQPNGGFTAQSVIAALSIRSALSLRPPTIEKHLRWVLDTILSAGDAVLLSAGQLKRKRGTSALDKLTGLKKPDPATPATDPWDVLTPVVKSALLEVTAQAAIDREEIETLWWMFAAYSELEQKPLAGLSPFEAAVCSGIELAQRALLPPSSSAIAMVKRAVESERKTTTLGPVSLQETAKHWSKSMVHALSPLDGNSDNSVLRYPALLPISWACRRLRESTDGSHKLGKEFTIATGIPVNQAQTPAEWGAQVFREKILQRIVVKS